MSQGFLAAEPETGVRAFGSLYSVIRTNFQALQSAHSGTAWPTSPVGGQHCWRTDYSPRRLYIYNDLSSSWDEVTLATAGLGLELIAARGSHASLDARLDSQINEDGTFKASMASGLNPSQWYDLTVASGWVSTWSFKAMGADYTTVYHPTRRLKINQTGGAYYTEVVSSSYGAPDTTVVTRDAVCGASQAVLRSVSHSIISPRKASGGDGAVSFEMVSNRGIGTASGATFTQAVGDSMIVVTAGSACAVTLQTAAVCAGRDVIIINASSYTATVNATWAVLAGQTLWLISDGTSWRRADIPLSLSNLVLSGTITGTYTLGGTPTITVIRNSILEVLFGTGTLTSGNWTNVGFSSEITDVGSNFTTPSYTVPTGGAGYYLVNIYLTGTHSGMTTVSAAPYKNGAAYQNTFLGTVLATQWHVRCSQIVQAAVGNTLGAGVNATFSTSASIGSNSSMNIQLIST